MHWGTILRNIFSNSTSYIVSAALGFLLTPLVVHSLGDTGYGLWTLVLSLTGYFGLLDMGIRSSVGRYVARHVALRDDEGVNRTVSTALVMLGAGGALAILATVAMASFFFDSLNIAPELAETGRVAFTITGLNLACALPLGAFSAVLIGLERFDVLSGVTIAGELTRAALVVTALRLEYGIVPLALIALAVNLGMYLAMFVFARRFHPFQIGWRFVSLANFRELFGFGIYRFIWIVSNQLIFYSDSVVIGAFLGAAAITHFTLARSITAYGRNVVSLVADTFAPSATRMDARQDLQGLQKLLLTGTKIALLVSLPLCLGFIFFGKQFIVLWMGERYASSAVFLLILAIPQITSMPQYVSTLVLAGMARHKMLAYFAFAEGVANLALTILLIRKSGLMGVALGSAIPHAIATAVVVPAYTLRVVELSAREYIVKAWLRPLACGAILAPASYVLANFVNRPTWLAFAIEILVISVIFAALSIFICFDRGERAVAFEKLSKLRQRRAIAHEAASG